MSGNVPNHAAKRRTAGQGVVEYAGAIVIAVSLVGLVMFVVPPNVAGMLTNITNAAISFFSKYLPS